MKKYDMAMEVSPDTIPGMIINRIQPGMTVLEFGCAYGRMTKYMSESLHCDVSIVELDQEAYPVARVYAQDGFCGDIDQEGWYLHFSGQQFDRILFADVLEHLRDPLKALKRAKSLLKDDGEIIISIPNIGHNDILVKLFQNRFEYTSIGLLDNTHIHFWGKKNLAEFAEEAGFGIRVLDGVYQKPFYTEQKPDKDDVPDELLDLLTTREYNEVYQFFLVLQKQERMEQQGLSCEDQLKTFFSSWGVYAYWDIGTGYQSGQCTRLVPELMPNGKFRFYCDSIPEGCRKVRFDPSLGHQCLVSDIHVSTNICCCDIYPLNGASVNGVIAFSNTNPQMEFSLPQGAQWFDISASIRICSGVEFGEVFSALQKLPQEKAKVDSLQAQLAEKASENEDLLDQIEDLCAQVEVFREHSQWKDEKIEELELHLSQICQLQQTSQNAQKDAQKDAQIASLQASYAALNLQFHNVVDSQCWKLTKPLRILLTAFKKTPVGALPYKVIHSLRVSRRKESQANAILSSPQTVTASDSQNQSVATHKTLSALAGKLEESGGQIYNRDRIFVTGISTMKKVLLISHELNLTGAPVALGYLAKSLKKQGYFPVIISPHNGALCDQFVEDGYPVFIYDQVYQDDLVYQYANVFDVVVVCTIVGAPIVSQLNGTNTSVLWWIHEAHTSYHAGTLSQMPETLKENIHVFCGGKYAEQVLKQYRPSYNVNQLLYYVPDYSAQLPVQPTFELKHSDGKIIFAIVGMQEERKGQDVLVKAIRCLAPDVRKKCLFVFVGKPYYPPIFKDILSICEDYPRNTLYIEELNRTDLTSLYMQINCLICASRDDPMPIVVTEAMLMSKAIICSENTGSADFLNTMNAGLVYHNNDPAELAQCIEYIQAHRGEDLLPMCRMARKAYDQFFTEEVFDSSVKRIFDTICPARPPLIPFDGKVSVVIPSYNAGQEFGALLHCLQAQEGIGSIEIVVVDSESKDGTPDLAEKLGANVIRILQSEFSHSYARNLGAEHASGEYLLFMTQDATPDGPNWICGLLQPVLHNGVVAVSCQEKPRDDCDLLGRISIWCHSDYMGILESDRIMQLPDHQDYDSMRRNGQLNDVACLVQRDLFLQFKYRGEYAEDLDLGLRLIKAGYTLALLSSVLVIHSHTRPPLYHMKRALVDLRTLKNILPDLPVETVSAQVLADRVVTACCAMALYLKQAALRKETESWHAFWQWSNTCFSEIDEELEQKDCDELMSIIQTDVCRMDKDIGQLAEDLLYAYRPHFALNTSTSQSWQFFLGNVVSRYFASHGIVFDTRVKQEVLDLLPKYAAQLIGCLLASYTFSSPDEDSILQKMISQYSKGV